jgi:Tfp pilus assembly protein PilF
MGRILKIVLAVVGIVRAAIQAVGAVLAAAAVIGFSSHAVLAQGGSAEIAGVRPGVSTHGEIDVKWGEPVKKSGEQTFEYAPPPGLPGAQRIVVTYFDDTLQAARIDVYLIDPVSADTVRADDTLGSRTIARQNPRGYREELYANSFRGLILSSTSPDAKVTAMSYLSGRWLSDLYADRFHEYMRDNRYADARVEADKAVAIDPDYARGYLLQGEYFQSQKNDDEAIVRFIAAAGAKYSPVYVASAHILLIKEYGLKKFADKAQAELEKALHSAENAGQKVNAHLAYANVLRDQKRDAEAVKEWFAALEIDNNSNAAHAALADYYWDKRDYRAAFPYYHVLAEALDKARNSDETPQRRLNIYLRAAFCSAEAGEKDQAQSLYQKVLAIDPKDHLALNNLGVIYRDLGRLNDALSTYRKGLADAPDDSYLLNNYSQALLLAGKFEEARQQAEHELAHNSKDITAMFNMARGWAAQGKKKEALEWLQKAAAGGYRDRNLASDKSFEKLRGDDQFKKLAAQMGQQ